MVAADLSQVAAREVLHVLVLWLVQNCSQGNQVTRVLIDGKSRSVEVH